MKKHVICIEARPFAAFSNEQLDRLAARPDAEILDLVNLHKVELPVTEENITQMASYRNLTHQLTAGIAETGESLTNMLQGLVESGDIEQAATIYSEVLELLAFEDAVGETVTGQQQTEGPLPEPGVDVTVTPEEAEQMPVQPSATAPVAVPGQKTIIEEATETASGNGKRKSRCRKNTGGTTAAESAETVKAGAGDERYSLAAQYSP